jgi:hypothetical protein
MYDRPEIDTFSNFHAVSPFSSKLCAYCLVLIGWVIRTVLCKGSTQNAATGPPNWADAYSHSYHM